MNAKIAIARCIALIVIAVAFGGSLCADQIELTVVDDTSLVQDGAADDNNFGGRVELLTSNNTTSGGNRRFGLLRFDVSGLTGQFATIDSMTLRLRLRDGGGRMVPVTGQIMDIFRIARANAGWVEGTGLAGDAIANNVPNPGTATYRAKADDVTAANRILWAGANGLNTAGTDYFATAMGSTLAFNGATGYAPGVVLEIPLTGSGFTLTEMVNEWIADGAANAGLLIRGQSGTANGQIFFDSLETPDVGALAAKLIINYTPSVANAYTLWAQNNGLSGADADPFSDPDGDGSSNALEFGLNSDPKSGAASRRRAVSVAGDVFSITIPVRNGAAFSGAGALSADVDGIRYTVEGSADLTSWNLDIDEVVPALSGGLPPPDTGWSYRTFRIAGPASGGARAFIRISVTYL